MLDLQGFGEAVEAVFGDAILLFSVTWCSVSRRGALVRCSALRCLSFGEVFVRRGVSTFGEATAAMLSSVLLGLLLLPR